MPYDSIMRWETEGGATLPDHTEVVDASVRGRAEPEPDTKLRGAALARRLTPRVPPETLTPGVGGSLERGL
jgi:hypothetical protein